MGQRHWESLLIDDKERKMEKEMMLHTNLTVDDIASYVFLPGSPQRVERIAKYLDDPKFVKVNREHETWSGYLEGVKVLVTSTGMGGPSTCIALEELVRLGATTFIRVGSCASTSTKTERGDVVIPSSCVRMEGTGSHYAPIEFPAVPNIEVFDALRSAAEKLGYPVKVGTVITRDGFYTQNEAALKPVGYELVNKWNAYLQMGAIATEMEGSPLFLAAQSLGVRAGGAMVCATNFQKVDGDTKKYPISYEPRAIEVAVEAMRSLIIADKKGK